CGSSRQGHFDGMLTVVNILFNIVRPHLAVFGEKDFQQLSIIQRMVADLHMPIEIIGADIVREHDGLAKSSRNRYLNDVERTQAKEIVAALHIMQDAAEQGCDIQGILSAGKAHVTQQKINLDYLEVCDEHSLQPITALSDKVTARIFIAAFIGTTRLIDNKPLFAKKTEETSCV
ncbi:MAG TPA: pantoate--beta-alanine ligase, partial [Ghiorsea sp.]|nr:pantoate--beta-alanine ligase [Ghiorsea sp.]